MDSEDGGARTSVREELSTMSFEDLQKLKEKIGTKLYNSAIFNKKEETDRYRKFSRENKNRPREISSKFPVGRHRDILSIKKKIARDPRFDDLSGDFNQKIFKDNYKFLTEVKAEEKQHLLKELKEEQNPKKKKRIENLIKRYETQEQEEKRKKIIQESKKEHIKKQIQSLKEGKKVFFHKKSYDREQALAEKFLKLKGSGKLDKYLKRKMKKNARKERKSLPERNEKD